MDIKNDKITIKPLRDKDVDIFSKWLAKEYIYKWFCPDGEEHKMAWLDEVNNRNTQYHYMKHFIVYYNDKAIGFCLYLDCFFEKEYIPEHYGKTVDEKGTVFEIGYLIGEEEYLGKGIGKIIVKKLIGESAEIGGKEILACLLYTSLPLQVPWSSGRDGNNRCRPDELGVLPPIPVP